MTDLPTRNISIGLIRRMREDGWRWLARWNQPRGYFDFVTADCLEGETAREAIGREVAWVLDLDRSRDILVCNMAQCNLQFVECLPGQTMETSMKVAFYNVELYRSNAVEKVNSNTENAWLASQEICDGRTKDNLLLNPILKYLVGKSGVIQHWESSA